LPYLANLYNLYKLAKIKQLFAVRGTKMNDQEIFNRIKRALDDAPRNQYTVEMHLQMIKYADNLKSITAKEFCEGVGLKSSFGTEFSKMRNLTQRLKAAGLNTDLL
jgi:hypothetical protein